MWFQFYFKPHACHYLHMLGQTCSYFRLSDNYVAQKCSGMKSPSFITNKSRCLQDSRLNRVDILKSWDNMEYSLPHASNKVTFSSGDDLTFSHKSVL